MKRETECLRNIQPSLAMTWAGSCPIAQVLSQASPYEIFVYGIGLEQISLPIFRLSHVSIIPPLPMLIFTVIQLLHKRAKPGKLQNNQRSFRYRETLATKHLHKIRRSLRSKTGRKYLVTTPSVHLIAGSLVLLTKQLVVF